MVAAVLLYRGRYRGSCRERSRWLPILTLLAAVLYPVLSPAALPDRIGEPHFFPLPPLVLPDETGKKVDLASFRGRVVLVNFWATWCPPCVEEFPSMQRLKTALGREGLEILAVNAGEESDQVFSFTGVLETEIDFPVLYDTDMEIADAWGIRALPITIVVDRHGRGVYRVTGGRQWDSENIRQALRKLLE
ncbi:MAG: TlpA disulfide reductase family protein [Pseudomonadota bacterium]|nr:TlpA disulfide reductase family protein [Pseudomonadota bacterium]